MTLRVLVRGGGDLASGAILRMARAGWFVVVTELAQPLAVRRSVSFAQAIYDRVSWIENIEARAASNPQEAERILGQGAVVVVVDPECSAYEWYRPDVLLDARMLKERTDSRLIPETFQIGLGPGFFAGQNCHVVIETKRGPNLGRVIWEGSAEKDTMLPDMVQGYQGERVLRSPVDGVLSARASIGDILMQGQVIAAINGVEIAAPFDGVLRGIVQDGLSVLIGMKIGDIDPRTDPQLCWIVSDKALAVGGGVLEAILTRIDLRGRMWH